MDAVDEYIAVLDAYRVAAVKYRRAHDAWVYLNASVVQAERELETASLERHAAIEALNAATEAHQLDIAPADLVVEHSGRGTFSDDYLKTGQNP